jgi:hypothetical protein
MGGELSFSKSKFPDFWTTLNKMAIPKCWLLVFGEILGVERGGGDSPSDYFWRLKSSITISISDRMSPFWSFYDDAFYKNLICPQNITYNPSPEGCGVGVVILKDIISRPLNYVQQNDYIKMLIRGFGKMMGVGRHSPSDRFWRNFQNFSWMCLGKWWTWGGDIWRVITFWQ